MSSLIHMQNHRPVCVGIAVLLVAGMATRAQADTELRWKFKKGEKTRYEMKMELTQDTKAGDMPFQVRMNQTMDMTWEVTDVGDDGTATMNQTIDRVRMELTLPQAGQGPIKYDSQQQEKAPGTEMLAKIFDAMVGKPFVIKVTPLGKVVDLKTPEAILAAFKGMPAGQGGMFSEDGLKQMISQSMLPMPEEPVAVGKTWEKTAETQAPPFGKQITTSEYKFAGEEEVDGKKVDKIDLTLDMKFEASADAKARFKFKDNTSGGQVLWDNTAGQPVESQITSKMTFEISVDTNKIEQGITTKSVMKRVGSGDSREL